MQHVRRSTRSQVWDDSTWWRHRRGRRKWDLVPQVQPPWLKLFGRSNGLHSFKVYGFGFASLSPRNYESDLSSFVAVQLLDFSGFFLSFVLIPLSDLRERLIRILEGLGGQAGCHMCWALGSQRSLFGWLVLCSVGASWRCYL